MLMDIETGNIEKNHKKIKNKDRLIAKMILALGISTTIACTVGGVFAYNNLDDKLMKQYDILLTKQDVLADFMKTEEFKTAKDFQIKILETQLKNNEISKEFYDYKRNYINSLSFAEHVATSYDNLHLTQHLNTINEDCLEIGEEVSFARKMVGLSIIGSAGIGTLTIVHGMEKLKKTKNSKKEETQENNPSCNENCLGIRYYDSTTMTIRNTNGKNEENNEETYYDYTETLIPNPIKQKNDEDTLSK